MSTSVRTNVITALALILGTTPALGQGLGSRDVQQGAPQPPSQAPAETPQAPVTGRGYGGQVGPYGQAPQTPATQSPYGQVPGQERQAPQDTYAGQWKGQASWPLPGGVVMNFPISVDVQREGQAYRIRYTADVPAQSPEIQPSPTRWTATFQGGLQQAAPQPGAQPAGQSPYGSGQPAMNQPPTPTFLMGQSQDYTVSVLNTGQTQGPWFVSIGLMAERGQLMGQIGSPEIGFAQFQLNRAGVVPGAPGQPGQAGNSLEGDWSGMASDTLDNGQPIQFPAQLRVAQDPTTGRVSATYSSTIPYPDPDSGRTVQLLIEETFSGTTQNGRTVLSCPNVRIFEASSRQMITSFPATLELTFDAQGLKGSLGSQEMGYTELRLQRNSAGGWNPGGMNQGGMNQGGYGQQGPGAMNQGGWNPAGQNGGGWNQGSGWNQGGWNQPGQNQGGWNQGGWGQDSWDQDVFGDEPDTWVNESTGSGW